MIKLLILTLSVAISIVSPAHSDVYRSVDESGNIIFTDKPQKNSEKVDLPGLSTYKSPPHKKIKSEEARKPTGEFISYSEFKIIKPANKDTIRDPQGGISVEIQITPELQVQLGHQIILHIDGKKVASTTANKYKLTNVDRGAHTLSAQIIDNNGKPFSSLVSTVFYLVLVSDTNKKDPPVGYEPDYDPKASPGYKPKTSPGYKPSPSPGYKPKPSPGYKP